MLLQPAKGCCFVAILHQIIYKVHSGKCTEGKSVNTEHSSLAFSENGFLPEGCLVRKKVKTLRLSSEEHIYWI